MGRIREKLYDFRNRLRDRHMFSIIIGLFIICITLGIIIYKMQLQSRQVSENQYNKAFFELIDYVQNVETLLAKSLISKTPIHGAETLTQVWREANLALVYLSELPIASNELENTSKFLNQVSNYAYTLSLQTINGNYISQEQMDDLEQLHTYSVDLETTLNQLAYEIYEGALKWGELTSKKSLVFSQQVSNISKESFSNIEKNLNEYAGLIYDGAFSEHLVEPNQKGLTGEEIDETIAREKVQQFIGLDRIKDIKSNGLIFGDIEVYTFDVDMKDQKDKNYLYIEVTKTGGHIYSMNYNKEIGEHKLNEEEANQKGKEFLKSKGYPTMKETYYLKEDGAITINYAYVQGEVMVYADLVKLKIALDSGEIIGIESKGYINAHHVREFALPKISLEEAKQNINQNIEILGEEMALIPTKWRTEILCYEFKGKVKEREFLVYINAETGKEENILMIVNTPNGTLTM